MYTDIVILDTHQPAFNVTVIPFITPYCTTVTVYLLSFMCPCYYFHISDQTVDDNITKM